MSKIYEVTFVVEVEADNAAEAADKASSLIEDGHEDPTNVVILDENA